MYGTIKIFNEVNLHYTIGNSTIIYENKILFYSGGGNLIGCYHDCYNFINNIVILLHSPVHGLRYLFIQLFVS